MSNSITRAEAVDLIRSSGGKFFDVTFTKRSTGEVRQMNARLGVEKYLHGGLPAYDREAHGLICVWDSQKKGYRSIATESIVRLAIDGQVHIVSGN